MNIKTIFTFLSIAAISNTTIAQSVENTTTSYPKTVTLSKEQLKNKIKGGGRTNHRRYFRRTV